ncbi:MAG: 50S ribosomal protein L35ae [Promethearchaeota archaeon]
MPDNKITGVVVNYRRGRHTVHPLQALLKFDGYDDKNLAMQLLGKKVVWTTPSGKTIKGTITRPHGKKGVVRAQFKEGGLPGQALGTEIVAIL